MVSPADPGSKLRTTVTRVHAIILFLITIAATTGDLRRLIGHPTTPLAATIKATLRA